MPTIELLDAAPVVGQRSARFPPAGRQAPILVSPHAGFWRKLGAFLGPGYLVAVGYVDPGNWATGIAGGSAFGYELLSVVLISNLMAMLLQALAARLGIAAGIDLAQACRARFPGRVTFLLWLLCEIAIVACDVAELVGTAIAIQLLFDLPLETSLAIASFDVVLMLLLQRLGVRPLEAFVLALMLLIGACFAVELWLATPDPQAVLGGLLPSEQLVTDPQMLFLAIGILGATVMPHNLYLHSAIAQTRSLGRTQEQRRATLRFSVLDSSIALLFAFLINAGIVMLAAAAFHASGHQEVAGLDQAYRLLDPTLGTAAASTLFAVALLASGQNSAATATLAGQIVMEGFLDWRITPWRRRLLTRSLAMLPAVSMIALAGTAGATSLLVLSQVVLSLQLPFAVVPLLLFVADRRLMGGLACPRWLLCAGWAVAGIIVAANTKLLLDFL